MDTPLINPARLFFTVAVGFGNVPALAGYVGGRESLRPNRESPRREEPMSWH